MSRRYIYEEKKTGIKLNDSSIIIEVWDTKTGLKIATVLEGGILLTNLLNDLDSLTK